MNFSDLSSIGAGAAEAGDRTADILALAAPQDGLAESDADKDEGEFGVLLDLLALATQAVPQPGVPQPGVPAPAATPGTLESLTVASRAAVDAAEIFRQRAAMAVVPEADPAIDAALERPLEQAGPEIQTLLPGADGAEQARVADHAQARRAREIVARAIAGANQAAAAPMPDAALPTIAQPTDVPGVVPLATPDAAPQKDATTAPRVDADIESSSPPDMTAAVSEGAAADSVTPPARAHNVTLHPVHAGADSAAVAEAQPAVAASETLAPAPADASGASTDGNFADGGDPSDGQQTPSGKSSQNGASPRADAIVVDAFSPQLAARIYESAAAAATSAPPEIGELNDVVPQIVRSITLQSVGEIGHARVQLRPEHLGEVVIELRVEQGDVIASLEADRPEVRAWIESQAGELREALGAQGLELTHLAVRDREERRREEPREHQPRKQKRQPREQPLRFELPAA